jgi:Rrf2 family protein
MVYLVNQLPKRPLSLKEIASAEAVTEKYLEQIFMRLTRAGLLKTVKGPGGGYQLSKKPEKIKLKDIMSAVGESYAPVFCVADRRTKPCPRMRNCPIRPYWFRLKQMIEEFFDTHTLADVSKNKRKRRINVYATKNKKKDHKNR